MSRVRSGWLLLFTLIFFGAFALRLWNLGTQSLWHDEAWSVFSAYHPLAWGRQGTDPNAPPIFYLTLSLWQHLAGDEVWAMRFWSLLVGVITVAIVGCVTRRWFGDRAGILAAILVGASPILWVFSQEIRAYVAMPLLAITLLALVDSLLRQRDHLPRRVWLWLLIVEIVTLYVHNLSVPIIAWLNVTVTAAFIFRRQWRQLGLWLGTQAGALILYLPWLLTQKPTGTPLNTPPAFNLSLLWNIWQSYFTGIRALVNADSMLMALTAGFGLIAILGLLAAVAFRRSQRTWLILSQAILIPAFELAIILAAHIDFHPRYFIVGVPAMMMVIAAGWAALPHPLSPSPPAERGERQRCANPLRQNLTIVAISGVALFGVAMMARMAQVTYSSPIYQHDDFRSIAERYAQLGKDDAIIIPYGWEPTLDYYSQKMGFKARIIGVPLYSSADTIIERLQSELKTVKRVELLTWYQLPADIRGAYPCLLGAMGQPSGEALIVNGLRSDPYGSFTIRPFAPFDDRIGTRNEIGEFTTAESGVLQYLGIKAVPGLNGYCAITTWQVQRRVSENLRIAIRLQNQPGWELSRTDSDILSDQQLPTSLLAEGATGTAFSLLPLPPNSPSLYYYPIVVTVYSEKSLHGLPSCLRVPPPDPGPCLPTGINPKAGEVYKAPEPWTAVPLTGTTLSPNEYLYRKDVPTEKVLQQGQKIRVTLEWVQAREPGDFRIPVFLEGQGWKVFADAMNMFPPQADFLAWYELQIPADATGKLALKAGWNDQESILLGEYDVNPIPRLMSEPDMLMTQRLNINFPGVAMLIGSSVTQTPVKSGDPFPVTLLWKATDTPSTSYTVFVHLLDSNGQVIAQSDSLPMGGSRPTTSWLKGEYLIDTYTLTFSRRDYSGLATLEVGLYDPSSGKRVLLENSEDHFVLPVKIIVQ